MTAEHKSTAFKELTDEVNAVGMGGRSIEQVKKQLSDRKTKTRAKAAKQNRERQKTGGGSAASVALNEMESKLLANMNPQTITGIIKDGEVGGNVDTNLRGKGPTIDYNRIRRTIADE